MGDVSLNGNINIKNNLSLNGNINIIGNINAISSINGNIINAYTINSKLIGNVGSVTSGNLFVNSFYVGSNNSGNVILNGYMNQSVGNGTSPSNIQYGIGSLATSSNSTSTNQDNMGIGINVLSLLGVGQYNVGIGNYALQNFNNASSNIGIGFNVMNTMIGNSGANMNNIAIGTSSLYIAGDTSANTVNDNVAIGFNAGKAVKSSSLNVFIGSNSATSSTNNSSGAYGSNNILFGVLTDVSGGPYQYSTAIGYGSRISSSNQIMLGRSTETVVCPGALTANGTTILSGQVNMTASIASTGTTTGSLVVTGGIGASGAIYALSLNNTSDYRIKSEIVPLNNSFNVDNLKPVAYLNDITEKQDIGFLAHEVQKEYPFLVSGHKDGAELQTLNYIGLIGILVKEIQLLKQDIRELKNNR